MNFYDLRLIDQLSYLAKKQIPNVRPNGFTDPVSNGFIIPFDNTPSVNNTPYTPRYNDGISISGENKENPSSVLVYINNTTDVNYNSVVSRFGIGSNVTLTGNANDVIERCVTMFTALGEYDENFRRAAEKFKLLQEGLKGVDELSQEELDDINPNVDGGLTLSYFLSQLSSIMFHRNFPLQLNAKPVEDTPPYKFTTTSLSNELAYRFTPSGQTYPHIELVNGPKVNYENTCKTLSMYVVYTEGSDIIYGNLFTYNMKKEDSSYRQFTKNLLPILEESLRNCEQLKGHEGLVEFTINGIIKTLNSLPEKAPLYDYHCECDDD